MKLVVDQLQKRFDDQEVLRGASFTFEQGKIYGIIGRNGAGKTTTLKSILNLVHPSRGEIRFFGMELEKNELEKSMLTPSR